MTKYLVMFLTDGIFDTSIYHVDILFMQEYIKFTCSGCDLNIILDYLSELGFKLVTCNKDNGYIFTLNCDKLDEPTRAIENLKLLKENPNIMLESE